MPAYVVGIDLGTSNCAVAFADVAQGTEALVSDFPVAQLRRVAEVASLPLLPSCIYLPAPHEFPPESMKLPWGEDERPVIGEFARWQGARVPGRFVSSAKSWLCHPAVDRSAPILPWGAPQEVGKISPVEASARLLQHIRQAWDHVHPEALLSQQEVVITIPASFDEVARALTVRAAQEAGIKKFSLLEEPQAAFYDFTAKNHRELAERLRGVRLVLVIDVGGGTSDFTLVETSVNDGRPELRRIAVGEHLMLGGDNMDVALARKAEERMLAGGRKLSPIQLTQLVQAARMAKESLLGENGPPEYHVSIAAEGSRLLGGALSTRFTREELEAVLLNGFLPPSGPHDQPRHGGRVALQEMGLPYAHDPAITRHIAAFLQMHSVAAFTALTETPDPPRLPRPDAILLNGGVFNSPAIGERLLAVISSWWPDRPPIPLLQHESLDLAVARGAAYYGLVRHGLGQRISGGAAHALFVGLQKTGEENPMAVCLIPRGQEEGQTVELGQRVFQLSLGRPVRFPLYSSSLDRAERPGDVVPVTEDMQPLPPIHTLLTGSANRAAAVPVHLRAALSEIGTLELWCVAQDGKQVWRLEFELRGEPTETGSTVTESIPASFTEARIWVQQVFGGKHRSPAQAKPGAPNDVRDLWSALERTLGPRDQWRIAVLRELWGVLLAGASKRRRSAQHERIFYQLLGYTLRPGFGYPLDDWRSEQTAALFSQLVEFHKEKAVWSEFWILWRRIAGGLSKERHEEIWAYLKPFLASRILPAGSKGLSKPKGLQPEALDEMVRLAAALEHLEPAEKTELGAWIATRLRREPVAGPWPWTLGRLGARVPIYGSSHRVVQPQVATDWVELLLQPGLVGLEGALFSLAQLARLTGDRALDLDEQSRKRVISALQSGKAPESWLRMVTQVVQLEAADEARALGDTLPVGLILGPLDSRQNQGGA